MLDDGTQSAADSPAAPASSDTVSRTDQPDQTPPAAKNTGQAATAGDNAKSVDPKSVDAKSTDINAADAGDGTKTDKTASNWRAKIAAKTAADAKSADQTTSGETPNR